MLLIVLIIVMAFASLSVSMPKHLKQILPDYPHSKALFLSLQILGYTLLIIGLFLMGGLPDFWVALVTSLGWSSVIIIGIALGFSLIPDKRRRHK